MKKIIVQIAFIVCTVAVYAQGGSSYDNLSLTRVIMKRSMNYSVYLPPNYTTTTRSYPVLYLLHGMGDNHTSWLHNGDLKRTVDELIARRTIEPLIIVMPDAGISYYMNSMSGTSPYETYFFSEFIPYIEKMYRCNGNQRSVGGLSMGGYGAMLYALRKPEMFKTCLAFSAAVRTDEEMNTMSEADWNARYRIPLGEYSHDAIDSTKHVVPSYYLIHYSVLNLVVNLPAKERKIVRYYIDCGDDDFLYKGNSMLHIFMRDKNITHEYRVRNGGHTWDYWKTSLRDGLTYLNRR